MPVLERHQATSWSGSENERRDERGVCLPPARPPVSVPRFLVMAGTPCAVKPISGIGWTPHTTARDVSFERFEMYDGRVKVYEFRDQAWLLRVHRWHVIHRDDSYT